MNLTKISKHNYLQSNIFINKKMGIYLKFGIRVPISNEANECSKGIGGIQWATSSDTNVRGGADRQRVET